MKNTFFVFAGNIYIVGPVVKLMVILWLFLGSPHQHSVVSRTALLSLFGYILLQAIRARLTRCGRSWHACNMLQFKGMYRIPYIILLNILAHRVFYTNILCALSSS